MLRLLYTIFSIIMIAGFSGCKTQPEAEPIWQQIKISDLSPDVNAVDYDYLPETINLDIYVFRIPADQLKALDALWPVLSDKPFNYQNYLSLKNNSITAGFGQDQTWNKVADTFRLARARMIEKTSLLLTEAGGNFAPIGLLEEPKNIYYMALSGAVEETTIGPGNLYLYCKASRIPGSRGVASLDIIPVFSPSKDPVNRAEAPSLASSRKFSHLSFKIDRISPGQFIILAPNKKLKGDLTLSGLILSEELPVIGHQLKVFAIVCTIMTG